MKTPHLIAYRTSPEELASFAVRANLSRHRDMSPRAYAEAFYRDKSFVEVWVGIPLDKYDFQSQACEGNKFGLKAQDEKTYIWIAPSAKQALDKNPEAILMVSCKRTDDRIHVDFSWPAELPLDEAIQLAEKRNRDAVEDDIDPQRSKKNSRP